MDSKVRILSEIEFEDMFTPIKNELVRNSSFNGCMFETYGKELSYVEQFIADKRVITILDCKPYEDCIYLASGFHYANRLGYMILDKPYEFEFEVKLN